MKLTSAGVNRWRFKNKSQKIQTLFLFCWMVQSGVGHRLLVIVGVLASSAASLV